ncbi:MAG: histidine phosphatase family protein [Thermodesulfobacteriaceae bacterium]|nr:histidine phosphatase family protein [Thermodesulfobacteriaceae bacterium]MCX8040951.1 histidine phosphatase family protein [Thermodesulfobacteriaceae bacterium]MDW8135693.1 histidine phosphatase family protein [Thermodesulfobacterium sp.]
MKEILIIRHGPILKDFRKVFYGQLDVPLSEEGKILSEQVVSVLISLEIRKVFSSPLQRALYPATLLSEKKKVPLIIKEELKEINYGSWTGRPREEVYKEPLFWERLKNENLSPPGGESIKDLRKRAFKFLEELKKLEEGLYIVFTHGGFIKAFFCEIFNVESSKFFSWEVYHLKGNLITLFEDDFFILRGLNLEITNLHEILKSSYW